MEEEFNREEPRTEGADREMDILVKQAMGKATVKGKGKRQGITCMLSNKGKARHNALHGPHMSTKHWVVCNAHACHAYEYIQARLTVNALKLCSSR